MWPGRGSIGTRTRTSRTRKARGILCDSPVRFRGPRRVIAEDLDHSVKEKRYYCFGMAGGGVLTVRFTFRGGTIRIFGAGYWRRGRRIYERENQIHG